MNWLAHIYLSPDDEEWRIGNLLGDFINKGTDKSLLTENMQRGIRLHLEIDNFTDTHPLFLRSGARISPSRRLLAGILVDIFYDHFLAKNWRDWSAVPLKEFTNSFYQTLEYRKTVLPERLVRIMPSMIKDDWLASYREPAGIAGALNRIEKRLSVPSRISGALEELEQNYAGLEEDFDCFFKELILFKEKKTLTLLDE